MTNFYWGFDSNEYTLYLSRIWTSNATNSFAEDVFISENQMPWYSVAGFRTRIIVFENILLPTYTTGWFSNFSSLIRFINWDNLDVSNVINMSHMFDLCFNDNANPYPDFSEWDVSKVTDMSYMFKDNDGDSFNPNIGNWNVSNVTNMERMFYGCDGDSFNPDLSDWDVSNVTNMENMFYGCWGSSFNPNVDNWNVSNVTSMSSMFNRCDGNLFNPNLINWNVSNVTNMNGMFYYCRGNSFNPNFSNWDVSKVRDMRQMFYNCDQLSELDLKNWNTSNVIYMTNMFYNCTSLKKIVLGSNWKFRSGCGLSDPIEQEILNQNGSKYSGKWIRTKNINDRLDTTSRGVSANELISQYGTALSAGTYEWEIIHPTYIKVKDIVLDTTWNSDNHIIGGITLPTSVSVELKEYHSSQIAENSFNTYVYPIAQTQWIVDGQYPAEHIPTDYMMATKAVVIEVDFNKGQFPHYPAVPDPLPQGVPENSIFKGWTTDFEHLYTNNDVWELESLTLYAVYFTYEKILEQKIRNPQKLSEWLTVDLLYQDDEGNVISEKELNKNDNSLNLNYDVSLQTDFATLDKVVQINFPLDNFTITVAEPSTTWTASDAQQQWNFGDNINNIDYLVSDANNKIKKAQIRKAQLPTPTFPTPIAVSNTEPSDALIWIETN